MPSRTCSAAQGGRAMSLVVVGHRPGSARLHAERLRSLQGVNRGSSHQHKPRGPCTGGFTYSPTTSVSCSTNAGSVDSVQVRTRCGCRPCATDDGSTRDAGPGWRPSTANSSAWRRPAVPHTGCSRDKPRPSASRRPSGLAAHRRRHNRTDARIELPRDVRTWHPTRGQQDDATAKDPPLRGGAGAHPARQCGRCSSVSGNAATRFMGRKVPNRPPTYK